MKSDFIYGIHVVHQFLKTKPQDILEIFLSDSREDKRIQEILTLSKQFGLSLNRLDKKQLNQKFPEVAHQGVAARVRLQPVLTENDLTRLVEKTKQVQNRIPLFLVLDSVQDPHNLGACLRTSDACSVTAVIIPKDRSAALSAVVRKVACGAAETVPIVQVTNLVRSLEQLKMLGVWIIGTSAEATQSIYQVDLRGPVAIVLGAEGMGLRRLTEEHCDFLMHIPMSGVVESLNVSVASGVCLYEATRQRTI